MARRSANANQELNTWLDRHGYDHDQAKKTKTPHPYAKTAHAVRKADAMSAIREMGAKARFRDGEWIVNVPGGTENTAYYTNDPEDAIATARHMMQQHHSHARMATSPTGRKIYAAKERNHHITTHGREMLDADQFALPPGPKEKRRGIKGRLPIDTIARARNALTRAAQMKKRRHITAAQLNTVRHKVNRAFPEIHVSPIED
jgi:hypothetical protein